MIVFVAHACGRPKRGWLGEGVKGLYLSVEIL